MSLLRDPLLMQRPISHYISTSNFGLNHPQPKRPHLQKIELLQSRAEKADLHFEKIHNELKKPVALWRLIEEWQWARLRLPYCKGKLIFFVRI